METEVSCVFIVGMISIAPFFSNEVDQKVADSESEDRNAAACLVKDSGY